jgi:sorting nexin-9/18/33
LSYPDLITSTFPSPPESSSPSPVVLTVERRFSNFLSLQSYLSRKFPSLAIPPLPEKQYTGRFASDFIEARRRDLESWTRRICRHPILRYSDGVVAFLGVEDEAEWKKQAPKLEADKHVGPLFFSKYGRHFIPFPRVESRFRLSSNLLTLAPSSFCLPYSPFRSHSIYHPEFNIDLEDASLVMDRFATHLSSVGRGVEGLRDVWLKTRENERGKPFTLSLLNSSNFALTRWSED